MPYNKGTGAFDETPEQQQKREKLVEWARVAGMLKKALPAKTDLESPIPAGRTLDRNMNEIAPNKLPEMTSGDALRFVAAGLNDAAAAAQIATRLKESASFTFPDGWSATAHPDPSIAAKMAEVGAFHLTGPNGTQFLAFADSKSPQIGEKIKQAFGLSSKAADAAAIGRAYDERYDVTHAGIGRGGALAKLCAESASTFLKDVGDPIRPKTCVAINATSVPPQTYKSLGLAQKNFARTTIAIERDKDALGRSKPMEHSEDRFVVKEKAFGTVAGGPRAGQRREGSRVGPAVEPMAFPDTKILIRGRPDLHAPGNSTLKLLGEIDADIRGDLVRKHLLAATRMPEGQAQKVRHVQGHYTR